MILRADIFHVRDFNAKPDIPEVRSKNNMIQSLGILARGVQKWLGAGRVPNTSSELLKETLLPL